MPKIAFGKNTVTQSGAQTSHVVNFGKTFSSPPTVLIFVEDTDGISYEAWLNTVTKTNCGVNVYYASSAGKTLKIHWLAIGD